MYRKSSYKKHIDYTVLGLGMMAVMYIPCLLFYLAEKVTGSHIIHLILCAILVIYESGMFFAAGLITGDREEDWGPGSEELSRDLLHAGLACGLIYLILGLAARFLINKDDLYLAIRNIIALVVVPKYCGIFLSLAFLFILYSLIIRQFPDLMEHKKIIITVSLIGLAFSLLPSGSLGYALAGVFVGGSQYECIPIASHLPVFFFGYYCARTGSLSLSKRRNLMVSAGAIVLGLVLYLLHLKEPGKILIGGGAAFFAGCILTVGEPLFDQCRNLAVRILTGMGRAVVEMDSREGEKRTRKRVLVYLLGYTILFAISALLVFLTLIHRGESLVWTGDALSQYIPKIHRFMTYIPRVFHDLLHGNMDIAQYDFRSGMGSTVAISYDPLYWLYLLFSPGQVDKAYTLMSLVRYFLAGLSMSAMLLYFKKSWLSSYSASLAYAFSCYALYAGTRHFQFITPLILMPLMVVAMERLIRHGKWYMMTLMVTWSLLCSYYFLYMNTIALGVYFVCRILFTKEYRNLRTFFSKGLTIVGSYVLGTMMGIISIITSFGGYLGSARSEGGKLARLLSKNRMFYRPRWIEDTLISSITYNFSPGYWLKIGTIPLALFGAVLLFTRKSRKDLRAIFLVLTAFCIFPFAGFILGGFSGVTNRWSYIYTVLAGFLIATCIDTMDRLSKKDLIALFAVTGYYALLILFDENLQISSILGEMFFMALTLSVILLVNSRDYTGPSYIGKILMIGVTVLALSFNGTMFLTQTKKNGKPLASFTHYNSHDRLSRTSLRDLDKVPGYDPDEFVRSSALHGDVNTNCYSMLHDHYDVGTFSSTMNGSIVDYNRQMGNVDWSTVRVFDYNFRTYMNELASVRYMGTVSESFQNLVPYGYKKVYTSKEGFPLYENEYALPVGYTYDTVQDVRKTEDLPVIQRQEATMLTASVEAEDLAALEKKGIRLGSREDLDLRSKEIPVKNIKYKGIRQKNGMLYIDQDGGSMTLEFDSKKNAETYLVYMGDITKLDGGKSQTKKVKVSFDGTAYNYTFRTDAYKTGQTEHVLCLGYHQDRIHKVKLKFKTAGTIPCDKILLYSQPMKSYEKRVKALSENVLEDVKLSNNTLEGQIHLDQDKLLLISLPYQKGWTAYIDGKKADIYRANWQYMALAPGKGTHSIRLHFQIPGWNACILITLTGFILFIGIILVNMVRKRRKDL